MNERNRDSSSFFKGQICTFANETEVFHKGYFGRSVLAFILHMIYHLNEGGTMACVAPHGVLFRGNAEGVIHRS